MKKILASLSLIVTLSGVSHSARSQGVTLSVSGDSVTTEELSPELAQQRRDLQIGKSMDLFFGLFTSVNAMYVDEPDPKKMATTAIDAMLKELDPYTEYISAEEMADFEFMTTGKYGGIGSLIRQRGEWVEISQPYEGSPSAKAGLMGGDRLVEINGESLKGAGSEKVSSLLKGDPNTTFTLKYRPLSDTTTLKEIDITREVISIPSVPYFGLLKDSIGYIRFDSFTSDGAREVKDAIDKLNAQTQLRGIILDLRGNGGGVIGGAIDIAGMFLPKGSVVTSLKGRSRGSNTIYKTSTNPIFPELPLAVLIGSGSASASEILAGAIQDYDRGVVVGSRSFGKGLVQSTRGVGENEMVKVTIAKYYTPSGRCIQAIDYTHRNDDGSVKHVPDSLAQEFTTAAGRKVYDGGGINPDVVIKGDYLSKFSALLMAFGFVDDFSNLHVAQNPKAPIEGFVVDDKVYSQFVKFMQDKTIDYTSPAQTALKELRDYAKYESQFEAMKPLMDSLESKLTDDKRVLLEQHSDEIKELLASALINRWYYIRGAIEYDTQKGKDEVLWEAHDLLLDPKEYHRILSEQDTSKN